MWTRCIITNVFFLLLKHTGLMKLTTFKLKQEFRQILTFQGVFIAFVKYNFSDWPVVLLRKMVATSSFHGLWKSDSCTRLYGDLGGVQVSSLYRRGGGRPCSAKYWLTWGKVATSFRSSNPSYSPGGGAFSSELSDCPPPTSKATVWSFIQICKK